MHSQYTLNINQCEWSGILKFAAFPDTVYRDYVPTYLGRVSARRVNETVPVMPKSVRNYAIPHLTTSCRRCPAK